MCAWLDTAFTLDDTVLYFDKMQVAHKNV